MRIHLSVWLAIALIIVSGCHLKPDPYASFTPLGDWHSKPVQMLRPGMDKTITFYLKIRYEDQGQLYTEFRDTGHRDGVKLFEQDIDVIRPKAEPNINLKARKPITVSSPDIVGTQILDGLKCEISLPQSMTCLWGRDENGEPMTIILTRS